MKFVTNLEKNIYHDKSMGSVRGLFMKSPERINQDSCATYFTDKGFRVCVLADGMGGHESGDKWSANLVAYLFSKRNEISDVLNTLPRRPGVWNRYFEHMIGEFVLTMKSHYPECDGGTTLTYCHEVDPNVFVSISVGDSPSFVVSQDFAIQQFKLDDFGPDDFSGRITNCVGVFDEFKLTQDSKLIVLSPDSQYITLTDGFSDNLSAEAVAYCSNDFEFLPVLLNDMQLDLESDFPIIPLHLRTGYTNFYGRMKPDDIALAFVKFRTVFKYAHGYYQDNIAPCVDSGPFMIQESVDNISTVTLDSKSVDSSAVTVECSANDFEDFSVTDLSELPRITKLELAPVISTKSNIVGLEDHYVCFDASYAYRIFDLFDLDVLDIDYNQNYYLKKSEIQSVRHLFKSISLDEYCQLFKYNKDQLFLDDLPLGIFADNQVLIDKHDYFNAQDSKDIRIQRDFERVANKLLLMLFLSMGSYLMYQKFIGNL